MKILLLFLSLSLPVSALVAQGSLEIVPLKHRSVEQVMPVLRPLLEPGGVISGQGHQLIVRTSPRNLADIRKTLDAIDTPQRRLMILVRFESNADSRNNSVGVGGTLQAGGAALSTASSNPSGNPRDNTSGGIRGAAERAPIFGRTEVRAEVLSSRSASDERVDQRVQVLEGARAFISTGVSRPVTQSTVAAGPGGTIIQNSTVMQEIESGFDATPRVSGSKVFLDISPRRQTFAGTSQGASGAAEVQSQRAASSVSMALGEWIELGDTAEGGTQHATGLLSTRDARTSLSRRIFVKVEELRP